jgi:hypothetical protein
MNVERDLFEMFMAKQNDFDLLGDIAGYIHRIQNRANGQQAAVSYEHLRKLSNSINNAGHEERRSADIAYIENVMSEIAGDYEEYLP